MIKLYRYATILTVIVGIIILFKTMYQAITGSLAQHVPDSLQTLGPVIILGLLLRLPVPFHVMSVGLVLQKRWLNPLWARIATVAVVSSGVWLGISLAIRLVFSG